jgi:hypothetical protein
MKVGYPKDERSLRVEELEDGTWRVTEEVWRSFGPTGSFWTRPRELVRASPPKHYRVADRMEVPDTVVLRSSTGELLGLVAIS